jgi:hypothetical protein
MPGTNILKCGLSLITLFCELPVLSCMADARVTSFMTNTMQALQEVVATVPTSMQPTVHQRMCR